MHEDGLLFGYGADRAVRQGMVFVDPVRTRESRQCALRFRRTDESPLAYYLGQKELL